VQAGVPTVKAIIIKGKPGEGFVIAEFQISATSSLNKDEFVFVPSIIFSISLGQFPEF